MSQYYNGRDGVAHSQATGLTSDDHLQYGSHKLQRTYGYIAGRYVADYTGLNEKYDDVANTWTAKTSLATARYAVSSFSLNGFGYICGGITAAADPTSLVEKYDDVANSWATKLSLNTATRSFMAITLNGFGYTIGGYDGAANTGRTEKYDDVANTWTNKTSLGTVKRNNQGFSLNGFGYSGGGYIAAADAVVEKYDDVNNAWVAKTSLPAVRSAPGGFSINGYGYLSSGDDGANYTTASTRYDTVANAWTTKTAITSGTSYAGTFSLNGYGYLASGYQAGGIGNNPATQRYDDIANSWAAKANCTGGQGPGGFSIGYVTETTYLDPLIINDIMYVSRRAMVCGSFNTSATTSGLCNVAHGMSTTPTMAWAQIIETSATVGNMSLSLKALAGVYITFIVASCPLTTYSPTTSSIAANFVWIAKI